MSTTEQKNVAHIDRETPSILTVFTIPACEAGETMTLPVDAVAATVTPVWTTVTRVIYTAQQQPSAMTVCVPVMTGNDRYDRRPSSGVDLS